MSNRFKKQINHGPTKLNVTPSKITLSIQTLGLNEQLEAKPDLAQRQYNIKELLII